MDERILRIVQDVLNREDIEGLLTLGAPPGEYDAEAQLVGERIEGFVSNQPGATLSTENVLRTLEEVWTRMFGPFYEADLAKRKPALRRAATEIVRLVQGAAG
jgi:hypothetical protein